MIRTIKEFTCYGCSITAILKDSARLKEQMIAIDHQVFPVAGKIVIFRPEQEPEWFSDFKDWDYAYSNSDDLFQCARDLINVGWFVIVDDIFPYFALLEIAEQMQSIDIVNHSNVFEWNGIQVFKR